MSDPVRNQENRANRYEDARIEWVNQDTAPFEGTVEILQSGWIRLPQHNNLHPPNTVLSVTYNE